MPSFPTQYCKIMPTTAMAALVLESQSIATSYRLPGRFLAVCQFSDMPCLSKLSALSCCTERTVWFGEDRVVREDHMDPFVLTQYENRTPRVDAPTLVLPFRQPPWIEPHSLASLQQGEERYDIRRKRCFVPLIPFSRWRDTQPHSQVSATHV